VFLNQRGAEFSFFAPSAPPRPTHSNLSGVGVTTRQTLFLITIRFPLLSIYFCSSAFRLLLPFLQGLVSPIIGSSCSFVSFVTACSTAPSYSNPPNPLPHFLPLRPSLPYFFGRDSGGTNPLAR
jgi:hypothetical protein